MRKYFGLLCAAALLLPVGVIMSQSASAAGGTTCSKGATSATITPGILKLQTAANAEKNESTQQIKSHGTISGCSGGGVTSGTVTYNPKIADPTNCNSALDTKEPAAVPPTVGVLSIKWNNGKTTVVGSASLTGILPRGSDLNPTHLEVRGKVTSGTLFKGLTFDSKIIYTPNAGGCTAKNLTSSTTKPLKPLTIK
jgi:hypothetical protein